MKKTLCAQHKPQNQGLRSGRNKMSGFTLTELVVTMAIAGILVTMAVPSFSGVTAMERTKNTATDLYIALVRARSEALKFNATVSLSAKAGAWQNGWEIQDPATASVIEDHAAPEGVTITPVIGSNAIAYNAYGRIQGGKTSLQITSTNSSPVSRCVTVDTSGRPYIKASSC